MFSYVRVEALLSIDGPHDAYNAVVAGYMHVVLWIPISD